MSNNLSVLSASGAQICTTDKGGPGPVSGVRDRVKPVVGSRLTHPPYFGSFLKKVVGPDPTTYELAYFK